jgi:hypothetical protein
MENPVLRTGLNHPKCVAAIQLMQSDPKLATERFKDDPDVTQFLQEFGKVMAAHFEAIGSSSSRNDSSSRSGSGEEAKAIEELGPLAAQAVKKANHNSSSGSSQATGHMTVGIEEIDPEQQKVQKVRRYPIQPACHLTTRLCCRSSRTPNCAIC